MYRVKCLECGKVIEIDSYCDTGDTVSCKHCYSDFEVTGIDPLRIRSLGDGMLMDDEYEDEEEGNFE